MNVIDLLSIGNSKMDVFVLLHNLSNFSYDKFSNQISFPLGNKIPLDEFHFSLGGNACNVSVGVSRLGCKSSIASIIGSDEFSEKILRTLKNENVDTSFIVKTDNKKLNFNIILSYEGERTILGEKSNLNADLEIKDVSPKMIYLTGINGDWKKIYTNVFENYSNSKFIYNPGSRQIEENLDDIISFLPKIEYLFINVQEGQKIAKENNPDIEVLLNKLKSLGIGNIIMTDGINGSYSINKNNEIFHITAATNEKPVERTGAGDSYAAGFIYAILKGHSVDEAMRYGAINAENVIKKIGAQSGLLTDIEIEDLSNKNSNLIATKIQ